MAASDRREGPLALDGRLNDWSEIDAVQDGPLLAMMSRPNLQKAQLRYASVPAQIYTAWARDHFYLAFSLHGLALIRIRPTTTCTTRAGGPGARTCARC